jgi:phospholipid transport system substrate-binding protein
MVGYRMQRILLALAFTALLSSSGMAGPPTEQLRRSIDQVMAILSDPTLRGEGKAATRRAALRRVMAETIDFGEAAKRALATHWAPRTEAERAEFTELFKELVAYSYILRIEPYGGETVAWLGEAVDGDHATVRTKIHSRQGEDISVDYRLQRREHRWLVYDVAIGGVSLVGNYRMQFNTIIQTSSYAELLTRIRARLRELEALPPSAVGRGAPSLAVLL